MSPCGFTVAVRQQAHLEKNDRNREHIWCQLVNEADTLNTVSVSYIEMIAVSFICISK